MSAALIGLAGATAGVLPATPGFGDSVEPYLYNCEGSHGLKSMPLAVTVPETVQAGQALVVQWALGGQWLNSPGDVPGGGHVAVSGTVRMAGLWDGEATLNSAGVQTHEVVEEDMRLELPQTLEGRFAVPGAGQLWIRPGPVTVDFVPAETVVNDDSEQITYSEGDWLYFTGREAPPKESADHGRDVHATRERGAGATIDFVGTGIDYVTERDDDMGEVELSLDDGDPVTKDASRDAGDDPMPAQRKLGRQVLYSVRGLPYGVHRLEVRQGSPGRWLMVDAFRVVAETASTGVETPYRVVCSPPDDAPMIKVSVKRAEPAAGRSPTADKGLAAADEDEFAARGAQGGTVGQVRATPLGAPQTGHAPESSLVPLAMAGAGAVVALAGGLVVVVRRSRRSRYV